MNKSKSYLIAASASIVGNIAILLAHQLFTQRTLSSKHFLFSETLLENYFKDQVQFEWVKVSSKTRRTRLGQLFCSCLCSGKRDMNRA
jgi:hypothetical protein